MQIVRTTGGVHDFSWRSAATEGPAYLVRLPSSRTPRERMRRSSFAVKMKEIAQSQTG